eukprot:4299988-Prymnesium_polylepis.1
MATGEGCGWRLDGGGASGATGCGRACGAGAWSLSRSPSTCGESSSRRPPAHSADGGTRRRWPGRSPAPVAAVWGVPGDCMRWPRVE